MTAEWLQRVVDCHVARASAMGCGFRPSCTAVSAHRDHSFRASWSERSDAGGQRVSVLRSDLIAKATRRLFDGHRGAGASVVKLTMGISEPARGVSGRGLVVLEDASEDVAVDEFSLFPGRGAEAGGGDPVEVAQAAGAGLVEQCDGVGVEEFSVAACAT
jgi:hypothetical protein